MSNICSGAVMQLDSAVGPAVFIVFGPEPDGIVDPTFGRRIFGLWASHFDKQFENTHGFIWESFLTMPVWSNIANAPEPTA